LAGVADGEEDEVGEVGFGPAGAVAVCQSCTVEL
jgi:hypothetical protein